MTQMMRTRFYSTFLISFYLMMSYLIWIVLLEADQPFATVNRHPVRLRARHRHSSPRLALSGSSSAQP